MMPWPTKATLHSLSHIRHQRDAGERPGGNARPYPGFSLSGSWARVRTRTQKYIPDRKRSQKYTQLDAPGRTRTQKLWGGGSVCGEMQINS